MAGQQIGNYALVKKLATGGMAEVWLARQSGIEGFNRHIVVKRILPHLSEDPEFVQMFLNEAKIASRFNHPNIAQIYDLGNSDGQYFIAMEFIHGEDLGRLMRKAWSTGQWIARPLAIRIIAEACKGLYYAHTRSDDSGRALRVVHRDISPQNILISFDGSVKLVDFGIAKAADQASMTKSGAIKGKFAYMAPEQAGGKPLDARTDLFALGLVLYELLTGVRPLKRDSELATLQAALECAIDPPSVVAEVPSELDEVVMRALAKAPDDRYKDASAFQMALEEFLISQRLVATSVQISELMETLFADRRAEEQKLGAPNPVGQGESQQGLPAMAPEPPSRERATPSGEYEREGTGTDAARPGEAGRAGGRRGDPEQSDPQWEAPPAQPEQQVLPSRRYNNQGPAPGQTAMARAHTPNGPELTRQKPPTREFEEAPPDPAPSGPRIRRRPSGSHNGVNGNGVQEPHEDAAMQTYDTDPPDTLPPVPQPPPRRSNSSVKNLRRTGSGEMPEAPPRRSSANIAPVGSKVSSVMENLEKSGSVSKKKKKSQGSKESEVDKAQYDLEVLKAQQAKRRGFALLGLLVLSIGIVAAIFWRNSTTMIPGGDVPIILSVTSNPKTHVIVKHGGTLSKQPVDLGETPIEDAKGAFAGDTILLVNAEMCIHYEESIQFAEPFEHRRIEKSFSEGYLTVSSKPVVPNGLSIYCENQKRGTTGIKMTMYEGQHHLELRDDRLKDAVPFDVQITAKQYSKTSVELGDALRKGGAPPAPQGGP